MKSGLSEDQRLHWEEEEGEDCSACGKNQAGFSIRFKILQMYESKYLPSPCFAMPELVLEKNTFVKKL